jgi:hypothetical protein
MTIEEARKLIALVHTKNERKIGLYPLDAGAAPGCICTLAEYHDAWRMIREHTKEDHLGARH